MSVERFAIHYVYGWLFALTIGPCQLSVAPVMVSVQPYHQSFSLFCPSFMINLSSGLTLLLCAGASSQFVVSSRLRFIMVLTFCHCGVSAPLSSYPLCALLMKVLFLCLFPLLSGWMAYWRSLAISLFAVLPCPSFLSLWRRPSLDVIFSFVYFSLFPWEML